MQETIAESKNKLLSEISGSPDVTFITGRGNIGDHLIHAGTRQLLAGTPYKEIQIFRPRKRDRILGRTWKMGIQGLERIGGHTALITGGGGWCKPFHGLMPEALPLIEQRFERVIVLPSTVDTSFDLVRESLAQTKAFVFARERESYRQLQELCKTDIAHDCAFFFDYSPYKTPGQGLLTAYRKDAESAGGETPPGNNDISRSCNTLDEWLWTIARHESVETDRAHVMIAAAMLGKKVKYRLTNYHKVAAIAEYALEDLPVERIS